MSESRSNPVMSLIHYLTFAAFVAAKVTGTGYLATWSWWWLLLPQVPCVGFVLQRLGAI